ncbi:VOC family protein [Acinetobacter chinensis]|jgi:predicted enzyme related to lactoylglutathione lyase|uniref:VOC family protein n=1 Tax=Acinetobacter chinensis TaxID=2004650 RepID=A0A3B7LX39_9GAMM|nr:VOC family protein [Acinetobacter chinensis]AXY57342.1 VOC family protein [Acinetobacter chinensis]
MSNPVCWFEIYVNDMQRAKQFYQTVLSTEFSLLSDPTDNQMEMWAFPSDMNRYGASGSLVKMHGIEAGGNSTIIYFESKDCAVEEQKIEAAGGKIHQPKMSIGEHGHIVLAIDTEGNLFGLHSMQ